MTDVGHVTAMKRLHHKFCKDSCRHGDLQSFVGRDVRGLKRLLDRVILSVLIQHQVAD